MKMQLYDRKFPKQTEMVFETLVDRGFIKAGLTVEAEILEELLEIKYTDDPARFSFRYLSLKNYIESEGYFVTQADVHPGFRILQTVEMPNYADKKLIKSMAENFKVAYIMANHQGEMDEDTRKKFDAIKVKNARIAMAQQQILMDEFSIT